MANSTREIKFRAWGKRPYEIDGKERYWTQEEMNEIGGYYYTYGVSDNDGEFVLEQYTGLKDKNGKEIWEGDVVKGKYLGKLEEELLGVSIENGCLRPFNQEFGADWYCLHHKYCEVIGNVHENPDLLK